MGNYLKMADQQRIRALLDLGWTYRCIECETGVRRETIARYDPRRAPRAANLTAGATSQPADPTASAGAEAANPFAGRGGHGPPPLAAPYRAFVEDGLRRGLTAQRIRQDLCAERGYPGSCESVKRFARAFKRRHPRLVDVLQHPPGAEAQVDFFQGPPTFGSSR